MKYVGMLYDAVDEYGATKAQTFTTWKPIITDQDQPGYEVDRDGVKRYIMLNLSSNEPTAWVYIGPEPNIDTATPAHFYDLLGEFE